MSDKSYLEIIKRKLDDLTDRILKREASEDNFRVTYAQILEKINIKMDLFSSSNNSDQLALMGDEIKSLISLKDDTLQKKLKIIVQEQEEILGAVERISSAPEIIQSLQEARSNIQFLADSIESQKNSFDSVMTYVEKFGSLEKTNQMIEDKFETLNAQQFAFKDAISEQIKFLNEQSKEYNEKFVEIIGTINQDLNNILDRTKDTSGGDDVPTSSLNTKIEEIISEFNNTKEFIININNNLMTLIDVVDNIFQNEEIEKIHENIGKLLVNTTVLGEATQKLLTKEDTEKILANTLQANNSELKSDLKADYDETRSLIGEKQAELKDILAENYEETQEAAKSRNEDLKNLLVDKNQELKEYSEDIIKQLEERIVEKLDMSSLEGLRDYTAKIFEQGTDVLKEEIWTVRESFIETKKDISSFRDTIIEKLDKVKSEILAPNELKIDEAQDAIVNVVTEQNRITKNKVEETQKQIESLTTLIDSIQNESLSDMQKQIIAQVIQVVENVSFIEEAQDLHDHIDGTTDEIRADIGVLRDFGASSTESIIALLELINKNLRNVTGTDSYGIINVEDDLLKIRSDLGNITRTLINEEDLSDENLKDIYSNVVRLRAGMERLESAPVAEELREVRNRFEDINADISSISKRTNKLILNADEVNATLQKHIEDFAGIANYFGKLTENFNKESVIVAMSKKLDNLTETSNALHSSDKLINEALMYMAEWVDGISESFNEIKENVYEVSTAIKGVESVNEKIEEQELKLVLISEKVDSLMHRNDFMEMKSLLEFVASQISASNEKMAENSKMLTRLESMEKQLKKVEKNVDILTSYIEED